MIDKEIQFSELGSYPELESRINCETASILKHASRTEYNAVFLVSRLCELVTVVEIPAGKRRAHSVGSHNSMLVTVPFRWNAELCIDSFEKKWVYHTLDASTRNFGDWSESDIRKLVFRIGSEVVKTMIKKRRDSDLEIFKLQDIDLMVWFIEDCLVINKL